MHAVPRRRTATLAAEALIVTYPLVLMDLVKAQLTATARAGSLRAPVNEFAHMPRFAPAPLAPLITPNLDTLTSSAWLDLSSEPLVLSVPDMGGRYFAMPVFDAWTTTAAAIGARTTGTGAREFALVGPRFRGALPRHLAVIQLPTSTAWILAHVRCDGDDDSAAVRRLQKGIRLTPLSQYGRGIAAPDGRWRPRPSWSRHRWPGSRGWTRWSTSATWPASWRTTRPTGATALAWNGCPPSAWSRATRRPGP
ncbi:MAG: DUF1254 domain-containing protein [Kineosporiaceae bacterium]